MAQEIKILITGDASSAMSVVESFTSGLGKMALGFGSIAELGEKVTEKIIEGLKELKNFIPESIEQVNTLSKTFEGLQFQTGENLQQLSIYAAAMRLVGGSMDDLTGWFKGVTMAMRAHSSAFIENGIAANDDALMQMKPIEVLKASLDVIEHCTDSNKRLILEQELLGRSGQAQVPLMKRFFESLGEGEEILNTYGGAVTQAMIDTTHANERITGEAAERIQALKNQMHEQWSGAAQDWDQIKIYFYEFVSGLMGAVGIVVDTYHMVFDPITSFLDGVINKTIEAVQAIKNFLGWASQEAGQPMGDPALEKKEAADARGYRRGPEHLNGETVPETSEQIKAREEGQKQFEAALRKDKHDANQEAKKEAEVLNQLIEKRQSLELETLKAKKAVTFQEQNTKRIEEATQERDSTKSKISSDLAKAPALTLENQQAAQDAFDAADKVFQAKVKASWDTYQTEEVDGLLKLREEGAAIGAKGLESREIATEKHIETMRKMFAKLSFDEQTRIHFEEELEELKTIAHQKNVEDQTKTELEELKKRIKLKTDVEGPISKEDMQSEFNDFGTDEAKVAAVKQYKIEMHFDQGASAGALAGLRQFATQTDNLFTQMSKFALDMANTLSSSLGKAFTDVITKGMSFGNAMKEMWKSMSTAVVQALMQMAARQLVNLGVERMISAWKTADHARNVALNTADTIAAAQSAAAQEAINAGIIASDTTTSATQTALAETTMAAKIYAWYAGLGPWAIPAAAATIAAVIMAVSQIGKIAGRESGGPVTGGTPYIVGEAGQELFIPDQSGTIIPNHMLGNLQGNLSAHQNQVATLQAQAGSYGSAGLAANGGKAPDMRPIQVTGNIFADTLNGQRMINQMVNGANQGIGRYQG